MSLVKKAGGFLQDWAVHTSEFPDELRRWADQASQDLSESGRQFEQQSQQTGRQIEQNLRTSEGARFGATAGRWLSKPLNLVGSIVAIIAIIWAVRAGKL